jgi:DNA-binding LacI/PurR family transcriptional regulator
MATRHLLDCGRRRIAFLSGSLAHFSIREREHGYRRALYEAGVLGDPDLEAIAAPGFNVEDGAAEATRRLIEQPRGVDAIFAYNDAAALAAMRMCQSLGRRVPDDVAIVGFDDIPAAAGALIPLTTMRVDVEALGRSGVDLLVRGGPTDQHLTLPVKLVVRSSCGAEAASGQVRARRSR